MARHRLILLMVGWESPASKRPPARLFPAVLSLLTRLARSRPKPREQSRERQTARHLPDTGNHPPQPHPLDDPSACWPSRETGHQGTPERSPQSKESDRGRSSASDERSFAVALGKVLEVEEEL